MNKSKQHSTKETRYQLGSFRTPPLGSWGGTLLTLIILLAGTCYAFAQENTALQPYIYSTQLYRVPMGNIANDVKWELAEKDGSKYRDLGIVAWADSGRIDVAVDSSWVTVTFVDSLFAVGDTLLLKYSEYNSGTGNCIAVRNLEIVPKANTFFLSLPDDGAECNDLSGTVIPNDVDLADDYGFSFPFDVIINKAAQFRVTEWVFKGEFSIGSADYSLDNSVVTNTSGTSAKGYSWTISDVDVHTRDFTLTITLTEAQINNQIMSPYTVDTVTIYGELIGPPSIGVDVTLDINEGMAKSGESYIKLTKDNLNLGGDRQYIGTFYGIPETDVITIWK